MLQIIQCGLQLTGITTAGLIVQKKAPHSQDAVNFEPEIKPIVPIDDLDGNGKGEMVPVLEINASFWLMNAGTRQIR